MLSENTPSGMDALFAEARAVRKRVSGDIVYLRGLLEIGNICRKNCYYCGIRAGNRNNTRYEMTTDEILHACRWALDRNLGSVVLQSGERTGKAYTRRVEDIIMRIHDMSGGRLRVTLALGEQDADVYRRWHEAGADRYLLRIETSSEKLYKAWHPESHSFKRRRSCLFQLKKLGYQVGTGVLIGLPGQEIEDLVRDILFFKDIDVDMIGMGPYLYHPDTPMGRRHGKPDASHQLQMGLKMIAAARIFLKDVNLASTTALETLAAAGRELGIKAGANVVMPNLTPVRYKADYCLYPGKPGLSGSAQQALQNVVAGIKRSGCSVGWGEWGDSPHFSARRKKKGSA